LLINLRGVGKPEWVETKKADREARKLEKEGEKELRKAEREARKLES
jgi:hypothetical protein